MIGRAGERPGGTTEAFPGWARGAGRRSRAAIVASALVLLPAGCDERGGDRPRAERADGSAAAGPGAADAVADGDRPVCLAEEPFVGDGAVPLDGGGAGDAAEVADLRWEPYEGCERFVIDLAAEEGPAATAGDVEVEFLRDMGVVRVSLRDVEGVDRDATDAAFEGPLARAAYVVRSPEGRWTYVDLHLGEPGEAHAMVLDDPARVVVDLRPGGGPLPPPAATSQRVVVVRPRPGAASWPLTITGYARTFEANVVARVEAGGEEVHETFTTATAWVDAWGRYAMTIENGPSGPVRLHVGEHSARDGTWEGAEVRLEMR